jgi:methyl-accepting chemotaxis protein
MAETGGKRSYKNYLVSPRFQFRFVFWAVFSCFCLIFYFIAILYSVIRQYHIAVTSEVPEPVALVLDTIYESILARMAFGSFVILVFVTITGILVSHRSAGPILRLKRAITLAGSGDLDARVRFRKDDEFTEIANAFNSMMESISAKLGKK